MAGSGALILATPATVMAHGSQGDDGRNGRASDRGQTVADDRHDDNRWWQGWHHDDKPKPPVDPATCNDWQTRLNAWVENYKNTASKDIAFGTSYTAMVQTFVTDQGLTVNNYEALLANVEAKRVAATTGVMGMTAPDLNCEQDSAENTDRGIDRSSYKDVKRAMEEYKQALKQLTEAVRDSYGRNGFM